MLVIEITPEDVRTITRTIPARGENPARVLHEQPALFRLGGRSIIESRISHDSPEDKLPAGLYTLDGSSYQLNNYGSVELKKGYQQTIVTLSQAIAPYMAALKIKEF
ncbi:single-stranded DNA-binding protein [Vibrio sp. 10N.247.310.34]|uniref:single-stranded DNA-binding protein n=1 Tax=Vibrio sp. 10N.247.310.34 TaxID=3229982 RepID=UPI00355410FE